MYHEVLKCRPSPYPHAPVHGFLVFFCILLLKRGGSNCILYECAGNANLLQVKCQRLDKGEHLIEVKGYKNTNHSFKLPASDVVPL